MDKILLLCIIPLIWSVGLFIYNPKKFQVWEAVASFGITFVIICTVYFFSIYTDMYDTEIWNGEVVKKERIHDSYIESYSCNCRTVTTGFGKNKSTTRVCSTCYRTHYTVDWVVKTTIGKISLESLDRLSSSVYSTPDPIQYTNCYVGEPVSDARGYTNYIKASPQSLFNNYLAKPTYANKIPQYPKVHSYYKIDRVISVDSKLTEDQISDLNLALSNSLRKLGKLKQANIVVIVTEIDDPTYKNEVENNWIGGKKNDVVIFLGMDDNKFTWVDVMTWAGNKGNELFAVTVRDSLSTLGNFDVIGIDKIVSDNIVMMYNRPTMEQFKYLKDAVEPSDTAMIIAFLLSLVSCAGLIYFFYFKHSY